MKITRRKDQSGSLRDFYMEACASDDEVTSGIGLSMLHLIERLEASSDEREAWGLTSLYSLCLLPADENQSAQYVRVIATTGHYCIEYRMPGDIAPWPDACVKGETSSEDEALRMIVLAMDRSGGWASRDET